MFGKGSRREAEEPLLGRPTRQTQADAEAATQEEVVMRVLED